MLLKHALEKFIQIGTLEVIDVNGTKHVFSGKPGPKSVVRFHNKLFELKLLWDPDMAAGEGYMNGDFTIESGTLYDFLDVCTRNYALRPLSWTKTVDEFLLYPLRWLFQYNPKKAAKRNVAHHYDLNGDLYKLFLDKDMQYSCAYFRSPDDTLETAQENKKCHLAAKLRLQPKQKILDIGSGWGGLALYLAQHADVEVTGLTLSEEQFKVATARAEQMGLSDRVRFYLRDYREEQDQYDRIVSVGMFEHVGVPHYRQFFAQIQHLLKDNGIAVLHAIGHSTSPESKETWINKYIFPGGYCPSLSEVIKPIEHSKLFITDIELLRFHYAKTLQHWHSRFQAHRQQAQALYDERFCRMWEYYLLASEMAFLNLGYYVFQIQLVRDPHVVPMTRDYINEWEQRVYKPAYHANLVES